MLYNKVQSKQIMADAVPTRIEPNAKFPIKIQQPGKYYLTQDLEYNGTGNAIEILSDNVEIDLNGHIIKGPHKSDNFSTCIYIRCNNVTISNGSITGFMYGVKCEKESLDHCIENLDIHHINFDTNYFRAIRIDNGSNINIHNNQINKTGQFTGYKDSFAMGIEVYKGIEINIHDNIIKNTVAIGTGESVAICISDTCLNCNIAKNHIENEIVDDYNRSFGIWAPRGSISAHDNYIKNFTYPISPISNSKYLQISLFDNTIDGRYCLNNNEQFYKNNTVMDNGTECHDCPSYFLPEAKAGNKNAAYKLAMTETDKPSLDEKLYWLSKAAEAGHEESVRLLNIINDNSKVSIIIEEIPIIEASDLVQPIETPPSTIGVL
jgi:hypothetical protein